MYCNGYCVRCSFSVLGFTALCERYSMDSRSGSGTDRLTQALNNYLGLIVENIISSEGDILKFAGKYTPIIL